MIANGPLGFLLSTGKYCLSNLGFVVRNKRVVRTLDVARFLV